MTAQGPVLRDIHLPPEPAWWSVGWPSLLVLLVLLAFVALALAALARRLRPWWQRRRLRRSAQAELDRILRSTPATQLDGRVHQWLRRVAIAIDPQTARLQGRHWVDWLDAQAGGSWFSQGPGARLLATLHAPPAADRIEPEVLGELARRWLQRALR